MSSKFEEQDALWTWTTGPTSRYLEASSETVRNLVRAGKLPSRRTATGLRLFRPVDVKALARQRKRVRGGK